MTAADTERREGAEPVELLLVGCGIMGARHLAGYAELERVRPGSLLLRGVCDPRPEARERLVALAQERLGERPRGFAAIEEALEALPGVRAADVVTDPRSHPALAETLLAAGFDLQIEKPLAASVAAGRRIVSAAARENRIVAVAENYRRDPMARLQRHVIAAGGVGEPHLVQHLSVASGRSVMVTPWRHERSQGGIVVDMGVHYADMLEYLTGPVRSVSAGMRRVRPERLWEDAGVTRSVPVECEDLFAATLEFESGALGLWLMHFGSAGERQWLRAVHGTEGAVWGPPDRTGQPITLQRGDERLEGCAVAEAFPGYALAETEARFFGVRPGNYELPFREIDARLLAIETADFLDAVRERRAPEVDAVQGLRSVALALALAESATSGERVLVEDVLSGRVSAYQDSNLPGG